MHGKHAEWQLNAPIKTPRSPAKPTSPTKRRQRRATLNNAHTPTATSRSDATLPSAPAASPNSEFGLPATEDDGVRKPGASVAANGAQKQKEQQQQRLQHQLPKSISSQSASSSHSATVAAATSIERRQHHDEGEFSDPAEQFLHIGDGVMITYRVVAAPVPAASVFDSENFAEKLARARCASGCQLSLTEFFETESYPPAEGHVIITVKQTAEGFTLWQRGACTKGLDSSIGATRRSMHDSACARAFHDARHNGQNHHFRAIHQSPRDRDFHRLGWPAKHVLAPFYCADRRLADSRPTATFFPPHEAKHMEPAAARTSRIHCIRCGRPLP